MTTQRRILDLSHPTPVTIRDGDPADPADPRVPARRRAAADEPWTVTVHPGPVVPPEMSVASVDEVLAALGGFDLTAPFEVIARSLVPVLPRRRPMPQDSGREVTWHWTNGLVNTFGVDLGPALLFVTEALAAAWGVDEADLSYYAARTLETRLPGALARSEVLHDTTGGLPLRAWQSGDGWASALVLEPELLAQVFGIEPAIILAPMRDLLVALPIDTDPGLAAWMLDDFASLDPNGLDVPLLVYEDGWVVRHDRRQKRRRGRRRGTN